MRAPAQTPAALDPAAALAATGPAVWALCRRLDPEPEDAYQEVQEKVLRALPAFDPAGPATLRTWAVSIAHRHLVDRSRRRKVRGDVLAFEDTAAGGLDAERALVAAQDRRRVDAALADLPEAMRRVVVAHHLGGAGLEAVADAEGVAVGTIKSRLHRARARLLDLLGDR